MRIFRFDCRLKPIKMKRILLLLLLFSGMVRAQIVNIPDANFKTKLVSATTSSTTAMDQLGNLMVIDQNGDGEIQVSEALQVYKLDITNANISDFTGLQSFINVTELTCGMNPATGIDISTLVNMETFTMLPSNLTWVDLTGLTALKTFVCASPAIGSFNFSGLSNLEELRVPSCGLTTIDLSPLVNLKKLDVNDNQLLDIDVSMLALTELDCNDNLLTSLTLANMPSLTMLRFMNNEITTIDLSGVPNLILLAVDGNGMAAIDLSPVPALNYLSCSNNPLTGLNVSVVPSLQSLYCNNAGLTALDVSALAGMVYLECNNNEIPVLDVSAMTQLFQLKCNNNNLTTLNVQSTNFNTIECTDNLFAEIDISGYPMILHADLRNNPFLERIFIKGTGSTCCSDIKMTNNPNLTYVCADDGDNAYYQDYFISNGMDTVSVSSYCSFTPGSDYNTIQGTTLYDADNNGCSFSDALSTSRIKMTITDTTLSGSTFTTVDSGYTFYTEAGNFSVTPAIENPAYFNVLPPSAVVNFPMANGSVSVNDFCLTANGLHSDAEIVITPIRGAVPGFDATYKIVIRNKGNQVLMGSAVLNYNDDILDFVSSELAPTNQSPGNLTWNYSGLLPFETRAFTIVLNLNGAMETPPINVGDVLNYTTAITFAGSDEAPGDNYFEFAQVAVGAIDPNIKQCLEGNVVSTEMIGDYLHYAIDFENTGTAEAVNIVVRDVLDITKFNVGSLQILDSSHPMTVRQTGNTVEFIFEGINLEIGGHGNILLKIKTRDDLAVGDVVSNRADIYFDYNYPVDTGYANTTFQELSVVTPEDHSVAIYPNPTVGIVNISAVTEIKSVQLFDLQGRLLQVAQANNDSVSIDVSGKQSGVYFVKVISDKGTAIQKIVRQ